jgi:two-component system, OmpR family, sensor histidine kinase BaeS
VRGSLLWRLLGVQLLVIAIAVTVSGFAISQLAARTFMDIMMRYHVDPTTIEAEFHTAIRRILVASSLITASVAMLLGWALVTRIVRPLKQMMVLAERIAQGDYARRVDVRGRDEIERLAESLNQMAASLMRIEGLRRDLVANVAHELRTPLATLQGYLEALRDGVAPADHATLELLHEDVLRLVRLVDDLHQLSQFDARVSRLQRAPLDIPGLVARLVAVYRSEFAARGLTLEEAFDHGLPMVEADGDLVSQALRNLLDNALTYAPPGAAATVAVRLEGERVRVAVSNSGEGIAPGDLPHIFERFYRGEKSRSRETGGAGIGLSIVREIARAHGGETGAANQDGLTTVWFTLLVRRAAAKAPSAQTGPRRTEPGEGRRPGPGRSAPHCAEPRTPPAE